MKETVSVDVEDVKGVLDTVMDPCSIAVGVPMSLLAMGLVRHLAVDENGVVDIHLRMTSPGCHMGPLVFEPAILEKVGELPGVSEVRIDFLEAIGWTENDIAPEYRARLTATRQVRADRAPSAPRQG